MTARLERSWKERFAQLMEAGWTSACEGRIALSTYAVEWYKGRGKHHTLQVEIEGGRTVEVSISPTGRSVRIYVDGEEVKPLAARRIEAAVIEQALELRGVVIPEQRVTYSESALADRIDRLAAAVDCLRS